MTFRRRLSPTQREALYDRCRGEKQYPDCAICNLPIHPGQRWHQSHNRYLPRALGGEVDGIAHERCNLRHGSKHDVPLIAKVRGVRWTHIDAKRPERPMLGSKASGIKLPFRGPPIDRKTGQPWGRR